MAIKSNEKIYGIHSVTEFIKISPDRIINIWMQESIKSQFKTVIHEAAKNNDLSVQATKKDRLDKIIGNKNHQGIVIEVKRSNKELGSSLEADVTIYLNDEYNDLIKDINLPEYFITSKAICEKNKAVSYTHLTLPPIYSV